MKLECSIVFLPFHCKMEWQLDIPERIKFSVTGKLNCVLVSCICFAVLSKESLKMSVICTIFHHCVQVYCASGLCRLDMWTKGKVFQFIIIILTVAGVSTLTISKLVKSELSYTKAANVMCFPNWNFMVHLIDVSTNNNYWNKSKITKILSGCIAADVKCHLTLMGSRINEVRFSGAR